MVSDLIIPIFLSGDSRHGLYNTAKRELYERGGRHIATCTKAQAVAIVVLVLVSLFCTSLVIAFFRPFNREFRSFPLVDWSPSPPSRCMQRYVRSTTSR